MLKREDSRAPRPEQTPLLGDLEKVHSMLQASDASAEKSSDPLPRLSPGGKKLTRLEHLEQSLAKKKPSISVTSCYYYSGLRC